MNLSPSRFDRRIESAVDAIETNLRRLDRPSAGIVTHRTPRKDSFELPTDEELFDLRGIES
jgi:hypothetical protein